MNDPSYLAISPATNKIYIGTVLGSAPGLAALDEATKTSTTLVSTGISAYTMVLNSSTNKVYLASAGVDATLYVVDATSSVVSTIALGGIGGVSSSRQRVDVNPITNHVFVAASQNVLNIDGATNTIVDSFTANSSSIAVNPVTNKVYIATIGSNPGMLVYDPSTLSITPITGASGSTTGSVMIINPNTNTIYSVGPSSLQVINGATNTVTTTIPVGGTQATLVLDPGLNKIYVLVNTTTASQPPVLFNLYALDGATNNLDTITTGLNFVNGGILGAAVNPITHKLYIPDAQSNVFIVSPN